MPSPSTLVFDIGNVLIAWDPRNLYRSMFEDPDRMERFLSEICTPDWNLEQDRGRTFAQAVAELAERHPDLAAEIRAYDERWLDMIAGPIEGSVAILDDALAAGVPCYAITNFSVEKFAVARQAFPFLDRFRGIVVSGEHRIIKPDPEIYRLLLDSYGLSARDCVFVDDSEKNVDGARAVGMHALHFTTPDRLRSELRELGFPL